MSAYLVSDDTLNFIVSFASAERVSVRLNGERLCVQGNEQKIASILYTANVESVNDLYQQDSVSVGFRFRHYTQCQSAVALLKCLACFEYQACEVRNYENTPAHHIIDMIRRAAIRQLPGYDAAPWGL